MGNKKKNNKLLSTNAPEEDASEAWLTSYADLMTLIACFFILMMAFANYDPIGFSTEVEKIAEHFSGKSTDREKSEIEELMEKLKGHPDLSKLLKISLIRDELKIIFRSEYLFAQGETIMNKNATIALDILTHLVKNKNPLFRVIIGGHTDNTIYDRNKIFQSKWAISSLRAASVAERFEDAGFPKKQLILIGHADTKPIINNQDEFDKDIKHNNDRNRRVEILILTPKDDKSKNIKLGLGVYFSEHELFEKGQDSEKR